MDGVCSKGKSDWYKAKKMTTMRLVEYGPGETGVQGEFQNVP